MSRYKPPTSSGREKGVSHDTPRIPKDHKKSHQLRRTHPGLSPHARMEMGRTRGKLSDEQVISREQPSNSRGNYGYYGS